MSEVGKKIGEFFKGYRIAADLTISDVASYLELPNEKVVSQYELGELKIPLFQVFALSNLYNVSPDQVTELYYELAIDGAAESAAEGRAAKSSCGLQDKGGDSPVGIVSKLASKNVSEVVAG